MTDVRPPVSASSPDPLPDRLGERFQLGELIGRGTCSEVFRAHDLLLDREAAVKIFPVADDPRHEREVRLMASMDHPSLVPVYDVGRDAGRAFVVMALLEGGSLADRLESGPLGVGETLLAVASVADGLSHVHRGGVLHRDVTPRNVLFDGDGRAHLSDFGVAFVADAPRITDTGIVVGSAPYLAPEQVRGETVGAPADVYALGLVMIEALTARPAYEGAPLDAARARLERRPEMPAGLEFEVFALLEAMTADDPAHRPTAENVCIGLRRAALAAETLTPPYAMAPIVGAGSPDATTANLRPVAATATATGAFDAETPLEPAEVPARGRRRRLADAGGFMVAASVAAAVLLAGGVVVASAWTVDRVNTATPPAATVPPPTAEVVADPGGGSSGGGGHSSSSGSSDSSRSSDSSDSSDSSRSSDSSDSSGSSDETARTPSADDAGSPRQAVAERAPTTGPVTDGGSTSTTRPEPSTTTPEPTTSPSPTTTSSPSPTSSSSTSPSNSPSRRPLLPDLTPTGGTTTTTAPSSSTGTTTSSAAPSTTTSQATSEAAAAATGTTTHATTTHATTTTTPKRTVLGPAVEALGGGLR